MRHARPPGISSDAKNIVGGVKKVSSLPGKKQRPLRFKEGRCGQSSTSSDDYVSEEQVENFCYVAFLFGDKNQCYFG